MRAVNEMVDLAVLHGGQGTVYTAAYAGKPVIGFPMQFEQHLNLEKMVGHGVGLILSRHFFKDQDLLTAIEKIFGNYDQFLSNAQKLAKTLPPPQGDRKAAERLIELIDKYGIKNK